jgi:D-sedoheptulose 7-phosphate isomerase
MAESDHTAAVARHFHDAAKAADKASELIASAVADAAELIVGALMANHRLFSCGNGGSASDAEHLVAELVGRLEQERPGLPAVALSANSSVLTALANDYGFDDVFARQVRAFGSAGDVLIVFSASGNSVNVVQAVVAAHEREMPVIAFTGEGGGRIGEQLASSDRLIAVPATRIMRVQELHRVGIHAMCDVIDRVLLGGM